MILALVFVALGWAQSALPDPGSGPDPAEAEAGGMAPGPDPDPITGELPPPEGGMPPSPGGHPPEGEPHQAGPSAPAPPPQNADGTWTHRQGYPLTWDLALAQGHVATVDLMAPAGWRVARWYSADQSDKKQSGWRPDLNRSPESVRSRVETLFLPPGTYTLRIRSTGLDQSRTLRVAEWPDGRTVGVRRPDGAGLPWAWRWTPEGGTDGLSLGFLTRSGRPRVAVDDQDWTVLINGVPNTAGERVGPRTRTVDLRRPGPKPRKRTMVAGQPWYIRYALMPVTGFLLAVAGLAAWPHRRKREAWLALGLSTLVAILATRGVWADPSTLLIHAGGPISDPGDSAAQVATMADSLSRLSDVSVRFRTPEGGSWLGTGPSWLGYLVPILVSAIAGPIMGHNVGITLGMALLGWVTWMVVRAMGGTRAVALAAAAGAPVASAIIDAADAASLDRSTLFLVPLAVLGLDRAASHPGWRTAIAAGAGVAAVLYGQVYYGLYFALAAPFLVLPRLISRQFFRRLLALGAAGILAGLLCAPALWQLQSGLGVQSYSEESQTLKEAIALGEIDPAAPLSDDEARRASQGAERVEQTQFDMDTPRGRLLAATGQGLPMDWVMGPRRIFHGELLAWPLVLLCIVVARRRRRALTGAWDVAVLLVFGLGPILVRADGTVGPPLPFFYAMVELPGFEQLKNVQRFGLMAATIAPVPIALGLSGIHQRLRARWPVNGQRLGVALAIAWGLGWMFVHPGAVGDYVEAKNTGDWSRVKPFIGFDEEIKTRAYPIPTSLAEAPSAAVLALPMLHPTPDRISIPVLAAGHDLINDPPYELPRSELPQLTEVNATLARMAWLSGSDRARGWLAWSQADLGPDLARLWDLGLRYVVLYPEQLPGPELADPTLAFLDAILEPMEGTSEVRIWRLPAPQAPQASED